MLDEVATLARFALVGLATNGLGFMVYVLLTNHLMTPLVTLSILYPLSIIVSYKSHRRLSFKKPSSGNTRRFSSFAKGQIACYFLNLAVLYIFVELFGFSHLVVQAATVIMIGTLLFLINRIYVFRDDHDQHRI